MQLHALGGLYPPAPPSGRGHSLGELPPPTLAVPVRPSHRWAPQSRALACLLSVAVLEEVGQGTMVSLEQALRRGAIAARV